MIRRAKPLLGTIVSIATDAPPGAVEQAFAAVERVHACMSAQRAQSDIGRINREAHRHPVTVDPWTLAVLEHALRVSEATAGAFDVVVPGAGARYTDIMLANGAVLTLPPPIPVQRSHGFTRPTTRRGAECAPPSVKRFRLPGSQCHHVPRLSA